MNEQLSVPISRTPSRGTHAPAAASAGNAYNEEEREREFAWSGPAYVAIYSFPEDLNIELTRTKEAYALLNLLFTYRGTGGTCNLRRLVVLRPRGAGDDDCEIMVETEEPKDAISLTGTMEAVDMPVPVAPAESYRGRLQYRYIRQTEFEEAWD